LPAADAVVGMVGGAILLAHFLSQKRVTQDAAASINELPG
jgi:hypothetical protein